MQNLLSLRQHTQILTHPQPQLCWYVNADHTYGTSKRHCVEDTPMALRTISGAGRMELRDSAVISLEADSLFLLNKKEVLNYAAGKDGWEFYWFEFTTDNAFSEHRQLITDLPVTAHELWALEQCFQSLNQGHVLQCTLAEALFSYLLADWQLRAAQNNSRGLSGPDLLELLEKGCRQHWDITRLARHAGMCERSFRDAVKKVTGVSPKAYMLRREMSAAMELLKTTNMTISELSASLGYGSPFYFSRAFKKHFGFSPRQLREDEKNIY